MELDQSLKDMVLRPNRLDESYQPGMTFHKEA